MKTELLTDDLKDLVMLRPRDVVIVVAAGVTIGALHGSPCATQASWRGLLESGIDHASAIGKLTQEEGASLRAMLGSDNTEFWIVVAEMITRALGGREGGEFKRWLRSTVGHFANSVRDRSVVDAMKALSGHGVLLATVNYDDIIAAATGLTPVTWRQPSQVERVLRGDERGLLYLHGHWGDPLSLVFGVRSYDEVVRDEHAREVLRSIRMQKTLVLVGHGAGLSDPNWGSFLRWTEGVFAGGEHRHFRLVREDERVAVQAQHPQEQRIFAISYGQSHDDLGPFLRSLLPTTSDPRPRGAASAASPSASVSASEISKTVIILVNVGDRDHHWLTADEARGLAGDREAVCLQVERVVDRVSMDAAEWRAIAQQLEAAVTDARAVEGRVEYVVAGVAPLPVFAYLGQLMTRAPGRPIRFINRRRIDGGVDVIGPFGKIERSERDRFEVVPTHRGEGRVALSIQCSREYAFNEAMLRPVLEAAGEPLYASYLIRDPLRSQFDDPMVAGDVPVLLRHVEDAMKWIGEECLGHTGLVLAIGGPSWVAFAVGLRLNPSVCGPRIDFPNFLPGKGYVPALSSPMHLAPMQSK